jgi:hypothetical protein
MRQPNRADQAWSPLRRDLRAYDRRRVPYIPSIATIRFAASDDGTGVVYTSDDAGQVTIGGGVGKERNGVFFDCSKPASGTAGARLDGRSCWSK